MPYIAGIDCGTSFTKAVILESDGRSGEWRAMGRGRSRSGVNVDASASTAFSEALEAATLPREAVTYVVSTGFGRYGVSFRDIQVTEITTAARGAHLVNPQSSTVLDIGGQCTRAIALTQAGKVRQFKSNDKCAAGSGMFIVRAARYLEVPVEQVGGLSLQAQHPQPISSVCAVLAESEIINHVSAGVSVEDILRGIHESLADRAGAMLKRVEMKDAITLIGGVALQAGMVKALENRLHVRVFVPEDCDFICALGAAWLGARRWAATHTAAPAAESICSS